MKRKLAFILSLAMMASLFASCGNDTISDTSATDTSNTTSSTTDTTINNDSIVDLTGEPDGVVAGTSTTFYSTNTNVPANQLPGYGGSVNSYL